ncbi:unnamed protein product [Clavelina lepadiformis]|uniref:Fibronectin type-III domain-containing protein n=1 Tax=Clavelina lepadiformis TaxID=159417 RepID=A0ABP0FYY4_CLALP
MKVLVDSGIGKPTGLTVETTTSSTIQVTWDAPSGGDAATITGYVLTWTPADGAGSMTATTDLSSPTTISGLNSNTEYTILVTATSDSGNGDASDAVTGTTGIGKPTGLTVGDTSSSTIQVTWDAPSGGDAATITGYVLTWTPADGAGSMTATTDLSSPTTISGLNSNTEYTILVTATSDSGNGDASDAVTGTTGIGKPTGLTVGDTSSSTIQVTWSAPSGGNAVDITGYELTWTPADGAGSMTATTDGSTPTTISGLNSNTEYSIQVTATTSGSGNGDASDAVTGTTAPPAPAIASITDIRSNQFLVTWTHSAAGATSKYRVDYSLSSDGSGGGSQEITGSSATSLTIDQDLVANTEYSVTVVAFVSSSTESDASAVTMATTAPPAPAIAPITNIQTNQFLVTWTHSAAGATTKYRVDYSPTSGGDGGGSQETTGSSATSLIIDQDLVANTEYSVTVVAFVSPTTESDASAAKLQNTIPLQVNQPSNSSDATTSKIYLSWDAVSGTSPSLTYTVSWTSSGPSGSRTDLTTTSTTISGLTASTRYSFTVTAVNDGGSADPSDPAMFSTLPNQPDSPTLTRLSSTSTTQINVEWNKPSGGDDIVDYVVDWWLSSSDGSMTSSGIVPGATASSYTIERLTPGETYDVTVKARNSAGAGQPSSSAKHTTNPKPPTGLDVINTTDESILISWTPPSTSDSVFDRQVEIKFSSSHCKTPDKLSICAHVFLTLIVFLFAYQVINYNEEGNSTQLEIRIDDTTSTSYNLTGLTSGVSYDISIFSVSNDVLSEAASITQATDTIGPFNIIILSQNTTSIEISWSPPPAKVQFDTYSLSYLAVGNATSQVDETVEKTKTSFVISPLVPGTLYRISVRSVGESTSDPVTEDIPTEPSMASFSLLSISNDQIEVEISPPQLGLVDEYNITWTVVRWISMNSADGSGDDQSDLPDAVYWMYGASNSVTIPAKQNNLTHHTICDLNAGEQYMISVVAIYKKVPALRNISLTATTEPFPVTNVSSVPTSSTSLVLTWSKPASGLWDSFLVFYRNRHNRHLIKTRMLKLNVDDLEPNTDYQFYITTVSFGVKSDPVIFKASTYLASCNFNVASISTTSISFLLYPITSVAPDGYQVSWQPVSNASDLMKVYVMNNQSRREEFTLDGLTPGMLYNVMVQCYLANVTSVPSNKTVSTKPQPVETLSVSDRNTSQSLVLKWSQPSHGLWDYYQITVENSSKAVYYDFNNRNCELVIDSLLPGHIYNCHVWSVSNGLRSAMKSILCQTVPEVATNATIVASTPYSVTLNIAYSGTGFIHSYLISWQPVCRRTLTKDDIGRKVVRYNGICTEATLCGLMPGSDYKFHIISLSGYLRSHAYITTSAHTSQPLNHRTQLTGNCLLITS